MRLRLASQSPRRAALLQAAGIPFEPGPFPDIEERLPPGLGPCAAVEAIARAKDYVTEAIRHADRLEVGGGHGPLHHGFATGA